MSENELRFNLVTSFNVRLDFLNHILGIYICHGYSTNFLRQKLSTGKQLPLPTTVHHITWMGVCRIMNRDLPFSLIQMI
jgi:hypothetical protein